MIRKDVGWCGEFYAQTTDGVQINDLYTYLYCASYNGSWAWQYNDSGTTPAPNNNRIKWPSMQTAIQNVIKYLMPGLQLVSFDPKTSISMIGKEAFASEETLLDAAARTASDVGMLNQEACVCSRVCPARALVTCRLRGCWATSSR